ncbi:MAG: protein-disulfide reductase DsbD family protein, partial [Octadecabacter sp.]
MKRIALTLAALVALSVPAAADPMDGVAAFDILPGWRTDRGTHMVAVRISLAPGWKTYWRAPGDAGIPPQFQWDGSQNINAAQFHWPIPEVMNQNGMRSIGYHGD